MRCMLQPLKSRWMSPKRSKYLFEQCGARGVSGGTMKNNYCIYICIYIYMYIYIICIYILVIYILYIYVLYYRFISFISMKWVMHLVIICSATPPILNKIRQVRQVPNPHQELWGTPGQLRTEESPGATCPAAGTHH